MAVKTKVERTAGALKSTVTQKDVGSIDDLTLNLRLLRAILDIPEDQKTMKSQPKRPKTPLAVALPQNSKVTKNSRLPSKNGKQGVIEQKPESLSMPPSSVPDQRKLAMNCFNQSLKILSAVVRKRQANRLRKCDEGAARDMEEDGRDVRDPGEILDEDSSNITKNAECACAALAILRLHDQDDTSADVANYKREQGAILLLDRMITLELRDLAHAEASKILEQYWKRRKARPKASASQKCSKKANLAYLISENREVRDKKDFEMLTSYQSQVLRLAILLGPTTVDRDFARSVRIETETSPASVLVSGQKNGYITAKAAGENLRVIAQALSRISAATMRSGQSTDPSRLNVAVELLVEAQLTRLISWQQLGHMPDVGNEYWIPVEKALRGMWSKHPQGNSQHYQCTMNSIEKLQIGLGRSSLPPKLPLSMDLLLCQLAEINEDGEAAVKNLERLYSVANGTEKLVHACRIATIALQARPLTETATDRVEKAALLLVSVMEHHTGLSAEDLMFIVRLRKACFEQLTSSTNDGARITECEMRVICLRTIVRILKFCCHFWRQGELSEKLRQSLNLASLKGIENILDAEGFATESALPVLLEYLRDLEDCVEIITGISNTSDPTIQIGIESGILHGLKIRISNVFWRAHIHPSITQAMELTPMKAAQISVACLDGLPIEELSKAALGPRLEKLCTMCMRDGEVAAAHNHARRAIRHYICMGALSDAVEASLSKRSNEVWTDAASLASQLGRAVHTHNSIFTSASDEAFIEDWIFRDDSLPSVHQAVLLEHQISYVLRKRADSITSSSLHKLVKEVVVLTCEGQYQVWSVRFVSSILFRASRISHLSSDTDALLKTANSTLNAISEEEDEALRPCSTTLFLRPYSASLQVQLQIQCALLIKIDQQKQRKLRQKLEYLLRMIESFPEPIEFGTIIDDVDCFSSVLEAYTDQVFTLCDYESAILCLKIRRYLGEHQTLSASIAVANCYTQLALCQVRLHDVKSARISLDQVGIILKMDQHAPRQVLQYQLVSAEYYLAMSDLTRCASSLNEAASVFAKLWPQGSSFSGREQIERDNVVARGALLASTLALRQGDLLRAHRYARQATKVSVSIWSALGKRLSPQPPADANTTVATLTEDMSKLNVDPDKRSHAPQMAGSRYWPYLDMHIRSIRHLVSMLSNSGLFEDALHYLELLKHIDSSVSLFETSISPGPALSLLLAKAGRRDQATCMINECVLCLGDRNHRLGLADAALTCCEAYIAQEDQSSARSLLSKISTIPFIDSAVSEKADAISVVVNSQEKARRGIGKAKVMKAPPKRQNNGVRSGAKKEQQDLTLSKEVIQLTHTQLIEESRHKAIILACQEASLINLDGNTVQLEGWSKPTSVQKAAPELYEEARFMLLSAWETLSADAFASVLTESAMALPARNKHTAKGSRVSFVQGGGNNIAARASQTSPSSSDTRSSYVPGTAYKLESALNICNTLLRERQHDCPTDLMHSLLKMEARISLLLTSMSRPFVMSSTDLVLRASQPKDCALERESIVSLAEQATSDRAALSIWPSNSTSRSTPAMALTEKQLGDLPTAWSVLSLTLAEGRDELLLSKTVAGRDPFLVRIPLQRSTDDEDGADEFVFDDAEKEMKEIIEAANSSSHDARGSLDKATRSQWHADREVLDQKLASFLENIETIWLGGFRGVLSPHPFDAKYIDAFGECLNKSLNKHLPSRQKGSVVEERVDIHDHILETFLGLGDPAENDLDDSIMDLLYFVVDILQFNGERNAYDEIDWDIILVEILDALKTHYSTVTAHEARHTILILDKELELFPWEALPCLIDHPVSRMPSLGSVFDRLTQIRAQSSSKKSSAYTIDKLSARGAYILNPSGDLKSTQESISPILADNILTSNYTPLIETPPTEPQFSSLLTKSDIMLYIGHSSGAQYIRPRTIRALPSCAVTFLFGCSSAKMTTHGKFESTGMPRAYMLGHAPAMVGCLWDVTDREIDRVAVQTLVSWGLVDSEDKKVQEILKRRGRKAKEKERVRSVKGDDGKVKTLIEAVKDGREACVLRYLCGAAVVVYGVPVVLE